MPEHTAWCHMKARCQNPKHKSFKHYGGRGIKVCQRWQSFDNFFEDMGRRPSRSHTLERKNNYVNYKPSNCVWATQKAQMNNTRKNRIVEFQGVQMTLAQWSEHLGVTYQSLQHRIKKGIPLDSPNNNRLPVMISCGGKTMPILHWSKALGIPNSTLRLRLKSGMTLSQIAPLFFSKKYNE